MYTAEHGPLAISSSLLLLWLLWLLLVVVVMIMVFGTFELDWQKHHPIFHSQHVVMITALEDLRSNPSLP